MSWIDTFLFGVQTIQVAGAPMPRERTVNFVGGVTGADDPLNGRTTLTFGTAFGGGGVAVSGSVTLSANSFVTISLASQDSTATLPTMSADGFVWITFTAGTQVLPHKCQVFTLGGALTIDSVTTNRQGLVPEVEFSDTGNALFYWNQSLGYWTQT